MSLREYARLAQNSGYEVVALSSSDRNRQILDDYGIRLVLSPRIVLHRPDRAMKSLAWYREFLVRERVDIVHSIHDHTVPFFVALSMHLRFRIVHTKATPTTETPEAFRNYIGLKWITYCKEFRALLAQRNIDEGSISVIPNRFDFSASVVQGQKASLQTKVQIAILGRLDPSKMSGLAQVLAFVASDPKIQREVECLVVGGGSCEEVVREKIERINVSAGSVVVECVGYKSDPWAELQNCKVVIGKGRCIMEALARCKDAVVICESGGASHVNFMNYRNLSENNFTGRGSILEPFNVAIDEALNSCLSNDGLSARLDLAERVIEDYDFSRASEIVLRIYAESYSIRLPPATFSGFFKLMRTTLSVCSRHFIDTRLKKLFVRSV